MKKLIIYTGADSYSDNNAAKYSLTVKDLINRLQEYEADMPVIISVDEGGAFSVIHNNDFYVFD